MNINEIRYVYWYIGILVLGIYSYMHISWWKQEIIFLQYYLTFRRSEIIRAAYNYLRIDPLKQSYSLIYLFL